MSDIPTPWRIILLADDPLVRAGLVSSIEADEQFVVSAQMAPGEFDDDTASMVEGDLIVIDEGWADDDTGVSSLVQSGGLPTLSLVDPAVFEILRRIPENSMISRESTPARLRSAIRAVLSGWIVVDPLASIANSTSARMDFTGVLTERETEVLILVAEGMTNKAISISLGISENTVKFHVNAILTKLNSQSRTEAVVTAVRSGLLPL